MDALAQRWRPSKGWGSLVRDAADALSRDPADCAAWCQLAMLFGDTRAVELAVIVCLHASTLPGDQRGVRSHLALCLMQLGLGHATVDPVPLVAVGEPGTVAPHRDALAAWASEHLAPFDGDAARAARHALAIAVAKLLE
jgi:hypothetical protein